MQTIELHESKAQDLQTGPLAHSFSIYLYGAPLLRQVLAGATVGLFKYIPVAGIGRNFDFHREVIIPVQPFHFRAAIRFPDGYLVV